MPTPHKVESLYLYAENQKEIEDFVKAAHAFIEEQRLEGRAVTAAKLAEALPKWKSNPFVKNGIINFLK